jgi:hypothetical protein
LVLVNNHGSFLALANCGHFAPRRGSAFEKFGSGAEMRFFLQNHRVPVLVFSFNVLMFHCFCVMAFLLPG